MSYRAVKTIWFREIKVHMRDKASVASSIARSLLWLLVFGGGFGAARFANLGVDYQVFLFPGVVAMSLVFTSMRSGISVIWDREFGFMKEILVSPASRLAITAGKILGGSTISTFEAMIILLLGPFFGLDLTVQNFMQSVVIMFLTSLSLVGMGLVVASYMKSFEGFQVVMTFLIMPMFFLSGALFPLDDVPAWMAVVTRINPLTYGVDALRATLTGIGAHTIQYDLLIIIAAAVAATTLGSKAFKSVQ